MSSFRTLKLIIRHAGGRLFAQRFLLPPSSLLRIGGNRPFVYPIVVINVPRERRGFCAEVSILSHRKRRKLLKTATFLIIILKPEPRALSHSTLSGTVVHDGASPLLRCTRKDGVYQGVYQVGYTQGVYQGGISLLLGSLGRHIPPPRLIREAYGPVGTKDGRHMAQ